MYSNNDDDYSFAYGLLQLYIHTIINRCAVTCTVLLAFCVSVFGLIYVCMLQLNKCKCTHLKLTKTVAMVVINTNEHDSCCFKL